MPLNKKAAKEKDLSDLIIPSSFYTGDVNSSTAWQILEKETAAELIDVRTEREWQEIGVPDVSRLGKDVSTVSIRKLPHMEINKDFAKEIEAKFPDKSTHLLFICKSGGRSSEAAGILAASGYKCYSVHDGFEGSPFTGPNGATTGWKSNLPWRKA